MDTLEAIVEAVIRALVEAIVETAIEALAKALVEVEGTVNPDEATGTFDEVVSEAIATLEETELTVSLATFELLATLELLDALELLATLELLDTIGTLGTLDALDTLTAFDCDINELTEAFNADADVEVETFDETGIEFTELVETEDVTGTFDVAEVVLDVTTETTELLEVVEGTTTNDADEVTGALDDDVKATIDTAEVTLVGLAMALQEGM